jgi:hypothetical protein
MSNPASKKLFDLYDRMDRIEELIEDMDELGIGTRDQAEALIVDLDSQIDELEAHDDSEAER